MKTDGVEEEAEGVLYIARADHQMSDKHTNMTLRGDADLINAIFFALRTDYRFHIISKHGQVIIEAIE